MSCYNTFAHKFLCYENDFSEPTKSGDFCFIYTSLVQDVAAEAKITKVQFKYFASDVNKSFEQSFTQCHSNKHLQSMELNIICEGIIGNCF